MRKLNPEWVELTKNIVNSSPYFQLKSMVLEELGPGESRVEIAVEHKHLQPFGLVHGGVFSGLVDAAGFWAAFTEIDDGLGMTTAELKLNYLAPSNNGLLIGHGRLIKHGRTLSLAEARVENEGGILMAHGLVTLMTLRPEAQQAPAKSGTPKFLDG